MLMPFPFTLSLFHAVSFMAPSLTRGQPPLSLARPPSQPVTSTASPTPVTSLLIDACPTLCCLCYTYAVPLLCPDPWLPDLAREKNRFFSPIRAPCGLPFPTFASFTSHVLKSLNPQNKFSACSFYLLGRVESRRWTEVVELDLASSCPFSLLCACCLLLPLSTGKWNPALCLFVCVVGELLPCLIDWFFFMLAWIWLRDLVLLMCRIYLVKRGVGYWLSLLCLGQVSVYSCLFTFGLPLGPLDSDWYTPLLMCCTTLVARRWKTLLVYLDFVAVGSNWVSYCY
jgi:hypothetical protein